MTVRRMGYGAGTKDRDFPNVLRAIIGEQTAMSQKPYLTGDALVIEANIDDMNPQHYEPLMAHLLAAGALDVALIPIQMKQQRPGIQLQIIANRDGLDNLLGIVFRESSTIGVRTYSVSRYMLPREIQTVQTPMAQSGSKSPATATRSSTPCPNTKIAAPLQNGQR